MSDNSLIAAALFGALTELALWGLYTCLFFSILFMMKRQQRKITLIVYIVIWIYVLNLVQIGTDMAKAYLGFVAYQAQGGPAVYFKGLGNDKIYVLDDLWLILLAISADSLLSWRVYIIWSRSKFVLVAPTCGLVIGLVCGIVMVGNDIYACYRGWSTTALAQHQVLALACFATTIGLNWYCTAMIIGRIWWIGRRTEQVSGRFASRYGAVVRALVESGFLYSFVMGAYLICSGLHWTSAKNFIRWMLPIIVGIVPTLIVLQMNLGYLQPSDSTPPPSTKRSSSGGATGFNSNAQTAVSSSSYSRPLNCTCGRCACAVVSSTGTGAGIGTRGHHRRRTTLSIPSRSPRPENVTNSMTGTNTLVAYSEKEDMDLKRISGIDGGGQNDLEGARNTLHVLGRHPEEGELDDSKSLDEVV